MYVCGGGKGRAHQFSLVKRRCAIEQAEVVVRLEHFLARKQRHLVVPLRFLGLALAAQAHLIKQQGRSLFLEVYRLANRGVGRDRVGVRAE